MSETLGDLATYAEERSLCGGISVVCRDLGYLIRLFDTFSGSRTLT